MYTRKNFKTKKALKEAVARGEKIEVFQPGPFGGSEACKEYPLPRKVALEGPHYPKPHSWYAEAVVVKGLVTKVS